MEGKGSLGAFIVDTTLYGKLKQVIVKFEKISDTTAVISGNISQITKNIKDGKGSVGLFLKDTMLIHNLNKSMENLKDGSKNFNQNMEAVKYSWPFKKYFKHQEKIKMQTK
jgi:phospholipid/cholesterol/gamma-HCH transport system substrate-binding protein